MSNDESREFISLTENINHLFNNCTHNFNEFDLTELSDRFGLVLNQCKFWEEVNNTARQIYDLKDFGMWFCDKIAQVENEFWGENEKSDETPTDS
tara:strand:+ start:154 stop:438 length:285 start_codon:yes stop_codon:yes gene_type:complete